MHHPTFIGNWKQSFFLIDVKKKKKYLQAYLDQRRHFSPPLWFHVKKCLERKSRYSTTTTFCSKARQEIRKVLFRNYKRHEVKTKHCNCTSDTSMHPRITHSHEPNETTCPVRTWSRHSMFYHQADNKHISKLIPNVHAENRGQIF